MSPRPALDQRARAVARIILAMLVVALALWVVRDFVVALVWAVVIAVTIWPIYVRFQRDLLGSRPALAALLGTLLTGAVLIMPLVLAAQPIAKVGDALTSFVVQSRDGGIPVPQWVGQVPVAGNYLEAWWRSNLGSAEVLTDWLRGSKFEQLAGWTTSLGGALLFRLFLFAITLCALYLMLRNGARLADRALVAADGLFGDHGERLVARLAEAVRATVNGTVVASVLKGVVIGAGFLLTGLMNPLLFTLVLMVLAMLPLGAWIVLVVAALTLLHQSGNLLTAVALFDFGAIVLLIGDNFVLPMLIGGAAEIPFVLVLIGIVGGVQSFGLVGLFLGPVIMAAMLAVWREWVGDLDPEKRHL